MEKMLLETNHMDLIQCVRFNEYGNKLATSSADHTIRVWELANGKWTLAAEWKAHGERGALFPPPPFFARRLGSPTSRRCRDSQARVGAARVR